MTHKDGVSTEIWGRYVDWWVCRGSCAAVITILSDGAPQMGFDGEAVWLEDMRLMREAGVNVASVGVFAGQAGGRLNTGQGSAVLLITWTR